MTPKKKTSFEIQYHDVWAVVLQYSTTTYGQWYYNRLHSKEIFFISGCSITYGAVLIMVHDT